MDCWCLDNFPGEQEEDRRRGFNTAWTLILPNISCMSEQSRDILRRYSRWSYSARQCTVAGWLRRVQSTTSGTLATCTPSSRKDWFQEEKVSKGTGSQCFSQLKPDVRQSRSGRSSIRSGANPELRCTRIPRGVHQNTVCWRNLKLVQRKGFAVLSNPIAAQSLFSTLYLRFVLRKWFFYENWRGFVLAKYINHPRLPRVVPHGKFAIWTSRSFLIPKREHPPTITANKACSTGKRVAHFSRTPVASIPKKVSEVSTGKPAAVTLITEFQVFLTQPSRKKTRIAKITVQVADSTVREITRTGTREYMIWTRLRRFNPFSEKSKELITSMGNTEYFRALRDFF